MPKDNPSVGRTSFRCSVLKTLNLHLICVRFFAIATALLAANLLGANFGLSDTRAYAQTPNTTVNYQARILTAAGAVVPDGNYHIEFKIYDDISSGTTSQGSCTGNCLWMETRSTGNLVRVVDGYVSVNLGSVTAFPSSMPWSQNLYITMRVGGNGGSASWDTEMTNSGNRMKLNGAPLAYVANNVASSNTNAASTNSSNISIQSGNALGTTSNSGNIVIDSGTATGTTGTITLGATNASGITLGRSGLTTSNAGALTVTQLLTANGGATIAGGSQFTNASSSLFSAMAIANLPTGGAIGTAAATVDVATTFSVNQTTASQTLTLPTPTTTTAGRLAFVNNVGSASFTMHGAVIAAGGSNAFMWNGSAWVTTVSLSGSVVNSVGTLDSQTKSADGAVISSNALYLQTADASYAGLVSTGSQTFAGDKTFNGSVVVGGNLTVDTNTLYVDSTNNRVGVGTTAPQAAFEVVGDIVSKGTSWTSRTAAHSAPWNSMTYGNGMFVAVASSGTGNRVMTSPDGINWTTRTSAGDYLWEAVTYGNGMFVAVGSSSGTSNQVMTSPDGINWTMRTSAANNSWTEVAYGNGLFVATSQSGTNNRVMTSPDGVNWTSRTSAADNTWSGLTYGNGMFVAVAQTGTGNRVMTSTDGISWNTQTSVDNTWTDVTYGNGIFVAVATNGTGVMTSSNGTSWTARNAAAANSWQDVSFGNGIFVAVAMTGSGNRVMTSVDGINWASRSSVADENWISVAYGNGVFAAVAQNTTTAMSSGKPETTPFSANNTYQGGLTVYGSSTFRSDANSSNAFQFQNASGTNVFAINTSTAGATVTGTLSVSGLTTLTTLGSADTNTYVCRNSSNQLATCTSTPLTSSLTDNTADAFDLQEGTNNYININTTNSSENISFGNATTNPSYSFLGSGTLAVAGAQTIGGNLTVDTSTFFVNSSSDFVSVGSTSDLGGRFQVVGANDETQLLVRANGTQSMSNPLVLLQNSSGSELARINATTSSLFFGNAAGGSSAAGVNNTGIGASALGSVSTGTGNTTLGSGALASVSVNNNNTAVGYNAGNLATGGNNIFLGALAGDNVTTGTDNIIIGYNLDASAAGVSNELRIGGVLQGNTSTLAAQFNGTLAITSLGTTDTATFICRNSSNILAGCNYTPLSSSLTDNITDAFDLQEGTNNYININTTNSSENISFGNVTTNPSYSFLGSGTTSFTGQITNTANTDSGANNIAIRNTSAGTSASSGLVFGNDTSANVSYIYQNGSANSGSAGFNSLNIMNGFNAPIALYTNGTVRLTVSGTGDTTLTGDLAVNGDDITSDGNLTVNATGYVRIGDTGTPGVASGDDDLYVEGDLEVDATVDIAGNLTVDTNTLYVDATNNRVGIGATPNATLQLSGNQSAASFSTGGIAMRVSAATYTDTGTAASGTQTIAVGTSFGVPTFAATNSNVTYTNAATLYISAAPSAGTNVTITNPYALYIASGNSIFGGDITTSTNLQVNGNTTLGNASTDRLTVTAQLLGGSPLTFQGATDNGFATTLAVTEPTANNTITLPDQSGTVLLGASGTGNAIVQVPTSNTAGAQGANVIAPTTNSIVGLKVSRTTGTATNAIQVNTATVADTTAQILVSTGATTQKGLVIQRVASQTANPLEVQNESGTPIAYVAASGNIITEGEFISQYSVRSSDGTGASSAFTVRSGNTTGGSGLSTGSLTLQSGNGSGTNTSSGNVILDAGSVSGSGTAGVVNIAQTNASAVNIGRAGVVTTLSGNIAVPNLSATTGTTFVCRNASNYLSGCTGTPITNALTDNTADAFDLQEGTNNYININTTDSSENISFGNAVTNPSYNFLGGGTLSVAGNLAVDTNTFVVDSTNNKVGIGTASPTEASRLVVTGTPGGTDNTLSYFISSSTATSGTYTGLINELTVSASSSSTAAHIGGSFDLITAGSQQVNDITALQGYLEFGGTSSVNNAVGVGSWAASYSGSASVTRYSAFAAPDHQGGSATIANNVGLNLEDRVSGTNNVNININNDVYTSPAGNWSIYNASAYDNYFAGNLGIGQSSSATIDANTLVVNNQATTDNILLLQDNGTNVLVVADGGNATFSGNVSVSANYSLTLNGGATGTRPASPTEGMIYYDTTTKQLLVYANGKWQTDRTDAILVAASNSSQTDKDIADYVGDGNTVAVNDGDQVQINNALTAASGRKVVLLAGTYTVDATILVPNNTTFMGVGNGTVVEFADIDATDYMIENSDTSTGTGVVIRDMKLDGRNDLNTGTQRAIYLNGLGNGTGTGTVMGGQVKNLTITRFNSEHIYLNNSDNNEISSNTSYNANGAIVLASSNNNTMTNNIMSFIQGVSAGGIIMTSSNYNVIDGNSITSSVLTGSLGYGLSDNGTNNIITNNSITTSLAIGSVRLTGTNSYTVFSGNFIGSDATTFTGTYINATNNTFSGSVTISGNNNTMSDNKVAGSITNSGSNTSITGNSVTISINASSGTYVNIENNTVSAATGTAITVASSNGSITGNTIITPTTTGISVTGANNTVSSNTITNSGGATANNGITITGDDNIVSANMVSDTSNSTTCNAIVINSGADRTYISSNKLIGCTAALPPVISDSGTNTTQSAQITRANSSLTTSSILRSKGTLVITGSIDPAASTTVPGVGTSFTTELEIGDRILVSGETRTITAISSDTSLTVDVAFSNNANDTSVDRLAASLLVRNSSNTNTIIVDSDGAATFRNSTNSTTAFSVQNSSGTSILSVDTTNSRVGINTSSPSADLSFGDGANRTINVIARTTAGTGYNLTVAAGQGNGANTGGALNLNGGAAGAANANGGNVVIAGGAGAGSGVSGLVVISNPTFQTATVQNFTSSGTITQANVDSNGAILISSNAAGYTATMGDPTITTAGRVVYVTNSGVFDMTLSVNGGGSGNTITLKPATTATMIWNGTDWTAAGASSSTDLQAAYNNTATSAGGAELVLNAPGGSADGLTIRNNGTSPIIGGLLEVQSSIGSNLFTVNNNATEYANNGGAESSTFTMWTGAFAGGTVTRYTTSTNVATGQGSVSVVTTATGHGAENTLTTTLTPNLKYAVAYTVKGTSNFSTLETVYSRDGTDTSTTSCNSAQTVTTSQFTRISCTFTAPSSGITASNSIFIRQTDATGRTFYIDNLSVTVSADVNHAADGSVDLALGSNWTDFGANTSGTTAAVRNTTVLYDTSGSVEKTTGATADRGIINNLTISPAVSTQYLVTFYARSSNTFNDIRVRYSRDGGTNFVSCTDYNTQSVSTTAYTRITCIFTTDSTTATNPDLVIDQPTATARTFYVDALTVSLNTNNSNNVQIGGGSRGGPTTLFTLDRSSGAPIAANNDAYLGSMYYDTSTGRIQCYEADGWGACGAAPDNIVNLNPEYAGAVLNGSGVGTMTADFCGNGGGLSTNTSLCASGESRNFYRWTSPQATQQTYSIYVTYQLPTTFNGFSSDDTIQLTGRVDSTTNAAVTYEVFRSTGSSITQCGTGETNVITTPTGSAGVAGTWYSYGINGNESTGCGFNSSAAGNFVIFKINLKANSSANAYVSTLSFTTTGR